MNAINPKQIRLLLVDDEPRVINGLERNLSLTEEGWEIHLAYSGAQGLEVLRKEPIDIVVSDLRMPEMDGFQFLAKAKEEFPSPLRFILSGYADQDLMIKATGVAHRYLSKPCNSRDLITAIYQVFHTQALIQNQEVTSLVNKTSELHASHGPIQEMLSATDDLESDLSALTDLIRRQPTLHATLLHVANTAFFGSGGQTETVEEGIQILGMEFIRSLAIMELAKSSLKLPPRLEELADRVIQHCVETSQCAFKLKAVRQDPKLIKSLASACLLHDLGKLLFLAGHKDDYADLWMRSAAERTPLWKLEREAYGCDHGAAGAYLFDLWGLPESFVRGVAWHHRPVNVMSDRLSLVPLLHLANHLAHHGKDHQPYYSGELEAGVAKRLGLSHSFASELN